MADRTACRPYCLFQGLDERDGMSRVLIHSEYMTLKGTPN